MKRFLKCPIEIEDAQTDNQKWVIVQIDAITNLQWCLELCLLEWDLSERLTVTDDGGSFKLVIRKDPDVRCQPPGGARWFSGGVEVLMCQNELEYWLSFFLKYYRDGAASVDHVDTDIPAGQSNTSTGLFLTIQVPDVLPGLKYEELRRRLGLP